MNMQRTVKLVTEQHPFSLGSLDLECAVGQLEDGTYVDILTGRKVEAVFGTTHSRGKNIVQEVTCEHRDKLIYVPGFLAAQNLQPFILPHMKQNFMPYTYKIKGMTAYGYDVDILRDICVIYSRASRAGVLLESQSRIANQAIDLLESLAGVGLHARVQETVGWHRGNLKSLHERYLLEIPSKWAPRFEQEYWEGAFKLHGTRFDPSHHHPAWVKGFVFRSVYAFVPDAIHREVSERNPVIDDEWRRKDHQHQWYSEEGKTKLIDNQIVRVICAGRQVQWKEHRRKEFWDKLAQMCQDEQVITAAWDEGLKGIADYGTDDLPLFTSGI